MLAIVGFPQVNRALKLFINRFTYNITDNIVMIYRFSSTSVKLRLKLYKTNICKILTILVTRFVFYIIFVFKLETYNHISEVIVSSRVRSVALRSKVIKFVR